MSFHVPAAIKPLPDYRLWLRFPDGVEGIADLSSIAGVGVFQRWENNPASFQNVKIAEDGSLLWDADLDLCSDALYLKITGKIAAEVFPCLK